MRVPEEDNRAPLPLYPPSKSATHGGYWWRLLVAVIGGGYFLIELG